MYDCDVMSVDLMNPDPADAKLSFMGAVTTITISTAAMSNPFLVLSEDIGSVTSTNISIMADSCVTSCLGMYRWLDWSWTTYDMAAVADELKWPDVNFGGAREDAPALSHIWDVAELIFMEFPPLDRECRLAMLHDRWHQIVSDDDDQMGLLFTVLQVSANTLDSTVRLRGAEVLNDTMSSLLKLKQSDNVSDLLG